jgi:hypothetical protein
VSQENVELVQSVFAGFIATGEPEWALDYYNNREQALAAVGLPG